MQATDPAVIAALIQDNYAPQAKFELQPISKGLENELFYLVLDGRPVVLRLYSHRHSTTGVRRIAEIACELDFSAHARAHHVPTPAAIPNQHGDKISTVNFGSHLRFAVLFEFVPGAEAPAYTPARAISIADLLMKMRQASLSFDYTQARPWPGDMVALSLQYYKENSHLLKAHKPILDALFSQAEVGYQRLLTKNLPTGLIHGDIKIENLLWANDTIQALLDFDDYRASFLLEELSRTVLHDLDSPTRNAIRSGNFPIFLDMLSNHPSVMAAELESLDTFLQARFIYDLTVYSIHGYQELVTELFADQHVSEVILAKI